MEVLDPQQLRRIEAVHRGFLFQHLFAVRCLLRPPDGVVAVAVEGDEDIELVCQDRRLYIQVKARARTLSSGELQATLNRFPQLASEHASGKRSGRPLFCIFSTTGVSVAVQEELVRLGIHLLTPGGPYPDEIRGLPEGWRGVDDALADCVEAAKRIPFSTLLPETLVWKLAAIVAYASAGGAGLGGHEIFVEDLPGLFEQFTEQLHTLPEPPPVYRPQRNEPTLDSVDECLLVIAHSGGGKTAWVSEAGLHTTRPLAYFDSAGFPDTAIASAFLREAAAQFHRLGVIDLAEVLRPGLAALDGLRALSRTVAQKAGIEKPILIIDNVHTAKPETIQRLTGAGRSFSWVLLGQPSPTRPLLEALLRTQAVDLQGWSEETIAMELTANGCTADLRTAARVAHVTGGLPLFVRNASLLTAGHHGGRTVDFCSEIETGTTTLETSQQAILSRVIVNLSSEARQAAGVMVLCDVPVTGKEAQRLLGGALTVSDTRASDLIRELRHWGVLVAFWDGTVKLHDAFRAIGPELQKDVEPEVLYAGQEVLADLLKASLGPGSIDRLVALCRLLPLLGRAAEVADTVSSLSEPLYEFGRSSELLGLLLAIAQDEKVPAPDRFLAADTAAFWFHWSGDKQRYGELLDLMDNLAAVHPFNAEDLGRLSGKRMIFEAERNNSEGVEEAYSQALQHSGNDPLLLRVLKYNYAAAQYKLQRYDVAEGLVSEVLREYEKLLGISLDRHVAGKNLPEIISALGEAIHDLDELKRFGDAIDLKARILGQTGRHVNTLFLNAHKVYLLAHAHTSAVKAGLDFVYALLEGPQVAAPAREFMEKILLPLVSDNKLLEDVVSVQSQYAVVLAYCGEIEAAQATIRRLFEFTDASSPRYEELVYRANLVERIARGELRLRPLVVSSLELSSGGSKRPKVGRNDPCPCGSGRKFKKCCGAST